jgi:UDP-N-acetyl-D-mannosaminuronic acid transferase (WecB/TagA/CpsF family)
MVSTVEQTVATATPPKSASHHRILGIDFFDGSAHAAIALMRNGGLLVVPAAPALKDLDHNAAYREALLNADLALTDSAFMVLLWNRLQSTRIRRRSGLEYLRCLLLEPDVREPGNTLWIMANPTSAGRNLAWLQQEGITLPEDMIYMAPMYAGPTHSNQSGSDVNFGCPTACPELAEGSGPSHVGSTNGIPSGNGVKSENPESTPTHKATNLSDPALLALIDRLRPRHIILTIGGGTQERLGLYLKRNLSYRPAIHCIGAAIAFLSGDQVRIPVWADKYYLGWLLRSLSEPKRYIPRYWKARKLLPLMLRHRSNLPTLKS